VRQAPAAPFTAGGTVTAGETSKPGADDEEREALRAEGFDPDDPAVVAAIDMARWELSLYLQLGPD
jgi:hypothetical protein